MTNRDKGTLAAKRDEINARYSQVKSWRKVAEKHYPNVRPGTLCAVAGGYVPKTAKVLAALGLPVQMPAPVCASCGVVHVRKTCPVKRKARKPRTGLTPRQKRWLAILGILYGGDGKVIK